MYSGDANPHPILDIAEQLLAMRATDTVKVYVQKNDDIAALRKVLKVCVYSAYSTIVYYVVQYSINKYLQERPF